jgi:hypothetical protein
VTELFLTLLFTFLAAAASSRTLRQHPGCWQRISVTMPNGICWLHWSAPKRRLIYQGQEKLVDLGTGADLCTARTMKSVCGM